SGETEESVPDLEGIARNFLPLLHQLSAAEATVLLMRHGEDFFRVADYLGGGKAATASGGGPLVHRNHPGLSGALIDGHRVRLEADAGDDLGIPALESSEGPRELRVFPVLWSGRTEAALVSISRAGEKDAGLPDWLDQAGEEATSAIESIARYTLPGPGPASDPARWFERLIKRSGAAREVRQAVHLAVEALQSVFDDATVSVAFRSDDGRRLEVYESLGPLSRNRSGRSFGIEDGIAGWVIRHGQSLRRNRMRLGDRAVRTFSSADDPDRKAGSLVAYPLIVSERECAGVLLLERAEDDGFNSADEPTVAGAASLLAQNLERLVVKEKRRDSVGRDYLTGLPGHSEFHEHLRVEVKEVRRFGRPVSVLMIDIDDFSSVNRKVGHRGGDEVMRSVSRRIVDSLGSEAFVARFGPDCFAACLAGVDRAEAEALAERISSSISERPFVVSSGEELLLSASIGGCTTHTDRRVAVLPMEAERNLLRARNAGRKRTIITELSPHPGTEETGG
ncbi:sensor domain-containing diguanylate cyclase, partial [Candidatus Fermentibacterales bacterium]|nr:sensor domain-containing diguanylate cyclase [Candidatus Fermentibacterales bacterium]